MDSYPTPWAIKELSPKSRRSDSDNVWVDAANGVPALLTERHKATAIIEAVNSHASLLSTIKELMEALEPFAMNNLTTDHVAKWDDETQVQVCFPRTRNAIPTTFVYIEQIRAARSALSRAKSLMEQKP